MKTKIWIFILYFWISQTITDGATTSGFSTNLSCYDCMESFKYLWEPYTVCQYSPQNTPLRPCLDIERYCKVERVTYKSVTVSITRSCTQKCWHGCYASGFGLTKLKCTSCCLESGCNIGSRASRPLPRFSCYFPSVLSVLTFIIISQKNEIF